MARDGQREGIRPRFRGWWWWCRRLLRATPHRSCCVSCAANGQLAQALQQASLPSVSYSTCSTSSYWGSTVKNTMVCAGGDGVRAGCQVSPRRRHYGSSPPTAFLLRYLIPSTDSVCYSWRLNEWPSMLATESENSKAARNSSCPMPPPQMHVFGPTTVCVLLACVCVCSLEVVCDPCPLWEQ